MEAKSSGRNSTDIKLSTDVKLTSEALAKNQEALSQVNTSSEAKSARNQVFIHKLPI